ncbi:MAG TPA: hypothetical protein VJH69_01865 [Candidatus Paceibacterota bacterium]
MKNLIDSAAKQIVALIFICTAAVVFFSPGFARAEPPFVPNDSTGLLTQQGEPGTLGAGAAKTAGGAGTANAGAAANEECLVPAWQGKSCWTRVGFIPVYGYCAAYGVCKATGVGNITGGFLQVGAQMFVGKFWGGVGNSIFGGGSAVVQPSQPQCPTRYRVSVPSSDPCAVYVPAVGTSTLNTSDALLRALGKPSSQITPTKSQPSVGNVLLNRVENVVAPTSGRVSGAAEINPIVPGAGGDIQLTTTGATISAEIVDARRNIQFSAFFGAKTLTEAPRTLPERMCIVRPWMHPPVAQKIPVYIFDGICSEKGYKTGLPAAVAAASIQPTASTKPAMTISPTTIATTSVAMPTIKPAAAIWAVPDSVPLGSRTTIFWNSQGVISCTQTSPDGNFTGNTKSGRESTVAITGPTTYIISCLAPDSSHVTDYVRVNLEI